MVSQFDMNQPPRICAICTEVHPISTPCKYDVLVKIIHTFKQNLLSLIKSNKEAVDTARIFQKIIRDMTPQTERLVNIEAEYNKLIDALKNAPVHPFAPSTDSNKPAPLVGVSIDILNEMLPPANTHSPEFAAWYKERYGKEHVENHSEMPGLQQSNVPAEETAKVQESGRTN